MKKKKLYKNKSFDELVDDIMNTKSTLVPKEVLLRDLYNNHKDYYTKQYIGSKSNKVRSKSNKG